MLDRVFHHFSALKTTQKKALVFSAFSLSQNNLANVSVPRPIHHASGINRQISPVSRVLFMSISRWFLLPQ